MFHRLETIPEKKLIGKSMTMSFADNKTFDLWKSFMPHRSAINNNLNNDLISLQVFDAEFDFTKFNPNTPFVKWAAVEVADFSFVPEGMKTFLLPGGLYAVFIHRGGPATAPQTFSYIFETWLPDSGYALDDRPHFEILSDKYKNNSPDSEEEIWIPVMIQPSN